ncbi:DNA-directed RNA polymerase core subunit rpc10 [Didymosphaeria variabile]|uniref:DNA-directed RNA polymerase core subunit rpc10 n=1 Tax=Didymosphaeria variabile TaxID=1932322 RepID=A0A9W8XNQ7_9PLEO|nr:DNA-directed RNA polymerase core subunit rpc10 [Didymosphaeria variabile]KAJ4353822.1 DNA-directed RNA polymerase core subunit rpc10 [Didymosphaeria variabile]
MTQDDEVMDFSDLPEFRRGSVEDGDDEHDKDFDAEEELTGLERVKEDEDEDENKGDDEEDDVGNENNLEGNDNDFVPHATSASTSEKKKIPSGVMESNIRMEGKSISKSMSVRAQVDAASERPDLPLLNYAARRPGVEGKERLKPTKYDCGWGCGQVVELKNGEPIRCKNCGCHFLLKRRTERLVQFEAR